MYLGAGFQSSKPHPHLHFGQVTVLRPFARQSGVERGPSPMAATAELAKFTWKTMPTCGVSTEEHALAPTIVFYKFLLYSN